MEGLIRCALHSLVLLLFALPLVAQQKATVEGLVLDAVEGTPIASATITLHTDGRRDPLAFAVSDLVGKYLLSYAPAEQATTPLRLVVRCMGYLPDTLLLRVDTLGRQTSPFTHQLRKLPVEIDAVDVTRPITVDGDTIRFNADYFTKLEDRTLEDVLKRLPGFHVETDGTIKFKNREIKKILLDGDDLTADRYRDISQSLHPSLLKEIQAIEHFVEDELLHGLVESEEVAINLTFKRPALAFGNGNLHAGPPQQYDGAVALLSFLPKAKSYAHAYANNAGRPIMNTFQAEEQFAIHPTIRRDIQTRTPIGNHFALNRSVGARLNSLIKPSDKFKIRATASSQGERLSNEQRQVGRYFLAEEYTLTDKSNGTARSRPLHAGLEGDYLMGNSRLVAKADFSARRKNFDAMGLSHVNQLPTDSVSERQTNTGNSFYSQLQYTRRLNSQTALLVQSRAGFGNLQEQYRVVSPLYATVPVFNQSDRILQNVQHQERHFRNWAMLYKRKGYHYYAAIAGHEYDRRHNLAALNRMEDGSPAALGGEFANEATNTFQNAYATLRYSFNDKQQNYYAALDTRQYWTRVLGRDSAFLALQPRVGFQARIGNFQSVRGDYAFKNRLLTDEAFYGQTILTGVRSLRIGLDQLLTIGTHQAMLSYGYNDMFFSQFSANFSINFSHSKRGLVMENLFDDNLFFFVGRPHKGQTTWTGSGSVKTALGDIRSMLELKANTGWTAYYAKNSDAIAQYNSRTSQYALLLHTGFNMPVNFNLELALDRQQTALAAKKVGQFDAFKARLLAKYRISETINNEALYQWYRVSGTDYHVLNNELVYRPQKGKLTFRLAAKNLLNIQALERYHINDFSEVVHSSSVLGQHVLVGVSLLIQ